MSDTNSGLYRDNKHLFGDRVDFHCPHDESGLRWSNELPGHYICPCCWTTFNAEETNAHVARKQREREQ